MDQPCHDVAMNGRAIARRRWWIQLTILASVALVVRLIHLAFIQHSPLSHLLVGDAQAYDRWAQQIAAGDWFGRGVFYQAPLYPYFLGLIYAVAGHHLRVVRLVQMILGALGCAALALAGRALVSRRAGLMAGWMLALYPPAIFFDGLIQKSALDLPLLAIALWCLARARPRRTNPTWPWPWLAGVALGLLMLSRENALVFVFGAVLWLGVPARGYANQYRRIIATLAIFCFGLVLVLAPVLVRNKVVGGEFHLTTSQFGPNFYIGNHAGADGLYQPLRFGRGDAAYEQADARDLAQQRLGRPLSPGEVSAYWTHQALTFITHEPIAYLKLLGRKTLLMFNAVEITDTEGLYAWSDVSPVLRWLGWWGMGLLLPLAGFGLVAGWRRLKHSWLILLLAGVYGVSVIAFYVFARYRLPVVPLLMLIAAAGLVRLPWLWRHRHRATLMAGVGVMVLAAILAWLPLVSRDQQRAISYANFARAFQSSQPPKVEQARTYYRKAMAMAPTYAGAPYNLGVLLLAEHQPAAALPLLEQAVREQPDSPDMLNQLGLARMATGDIAGAVAVYEQAVKLSPDFAEAHNNLGVALARLGRLDEARVHDEKAIALDPSMVQAHNNLGIVQARLGQLPAAIESFEHALRLDPGNSEAKANLAHARKLMTGQ
jgi:Flp pilus assembly protein TadD/4-amino-4-deoxy-L-arabinose transferase-like glycosyltransferase